MSNGMETDSESQITLTRTIAAHVSDVFAAWTDPALIEQWEADEAEFDAFEGGQYRFVTFAEDEGEENHEVSGEVLTFVEDERLVLSWIHKDEDEDSELIFVLDIAFKAIADDSTSIPLTERGLPRGTWSSRSMKVFSSASRLST